MAPDHHLRAAFHRCTPLLQVLPGGRVIWRSAAVRPPYVKLIEQAGFDVKCLQLADHGCMDRVNMYSSFYVAVRQ